MNKEATSGAVLTPACAREFENLLARSDPLWERSRALPFDHVGFAREWSKELSIIFLLILGIAFYRRSNLSTASLARSRAVSALINNKKKRG